MRMMTDDSVMNDTLDTITESPMRLDDSHMIDTSETTAQVQHDCHLNATDHPMPHESNSAAHDAQQQNHQIDDTRTHSPHATCRDDAQTLETPPRSVLFAESEQGLNRDSVLLKRYVMHKSMALYDEEVHRCEELRKRPCSLLELHEHRRSVLRRLERIIAQFVRRETPELEQQEVRRCCKVLTFGSCRLGVESWSSDIDMVAVVPFHVHRQLFFQELKGHLETLQEVWGMNAITDAYVPVLKFVFDGVAIDLLHAPIGEERIPLDFNILDEKWLTQVDDATQRTLNGPRVADEILQLVPNVDVFKFTLHCVKFWARRRRIYSNSFGYLGGIAWAILVANICRQYPNEAPNQLLQRFFEKYRHWKWPSPVLLKEIEDSADSSVRVWNPEKYPSDRAHLMPIITPSFPSMNASFNVSHTTLRLISEEFVRADSILSRGIKQPNFSNQDLDELFEENNFFIRYRDYLQLEVSAETPEEHHIWEAFIESRLRFLVLALEEVNAILVHPYPHSFRNPVEGKTSSLFYIGLKYLDTPSGGRSQKKVVDLTPAAEKFEFKLAEWDKKTSGMMTPVIKPVKRAQIPEFVCSSEKRKYFVRQRSIQRKRKLDELSGGSVPQNPSPYKRAKGKSDHAVVSQHKLDVSNSEAPLVEATSML